MSFTVGFDFGTHQTKVCIEDASNPAQKIYEFLEFKNPLGKSSVLFPSIVQINENDTLSYGFIDDEECKFIHSNGNDKPRLNLLDKPKLIIPEEPKKLILPNKPKEEPTSWRERLKSIFNKKKHQESPETLLWKEDCSRLQHEDELAFSKWENICASQKDDYKKELDKWNEDCYDQKKKYNSSLEEWNNNIKEKLYYRYFKLATFANSTGWNHEIDADLISVWYIAYILFTLQEKLGEDFFVQMGIPSGTNQTILNKQKKKAFTILIAAYKLVDHYKTKDSFLSEKYMNLLEATELNNQYSDEDVLFYGLNVVPEAYAGLSSITQQKRLAKGMSLLVDIGGGTTDVAFFTIRENKPDIHSVISFPIGLNYIFENHIINNKHLSIPDVQSIFFKNRGDESMFSSSISQYHNQLFNLVKRLVSDITMSFEFRRDFHQLHTSKLRDALKNRPVVFCGGGSIYKSMQTSLLNFTDIKLINKNLLNIPFIKNQKLNDKLFTILATSYGLCIPLENEIILTPIENVFDHIITSRSNQKDYSYEHGLSDF